MFHYTEDLSKKPPMIERLVLLSRGVSYLIARPSRLDNPFVFRSVVRDQLNAKIRHLFFQRNIFIKKIYPYRYVTPWGAVTEMTEFGPTLLVSRHTFEENF